MTNVFRKRDPSAAKTLQWIATGIGLFVAATAVYNRLTKFRLDGKIVLITGGSRGLGLELARQLAGKGAKLAICARSVESLQEARLELLASGAEVLAIPVDLTEKVQVRSLIDEVVKHYGRIDVLVNNAGIVQVGPQETMDLKDYEEAMDTNFWAALYTMHYALPFFMRQKSGRIVNVTSIGGKIAIPHLLPYSASKFALVGLSEGMHAELKKQNIHVTTVVPNLMRTGSPRNVTVKGDHEKEYAWFKLSDSLPFMSQRVQAAAKNIIRAIEYTQSEAVLTATAKIATMINGIAPSWVTLLLSLTNRLLPDNIEGGNEPRKGYQVESKRSRGVVAAMTDRAAVRNNEL